MIRLNNDQNSLTEKQTEQTVLKEQQNIIEKLETRFKDLMDVVTHFMLSMMLQ